MSDYHITAVLFVGVEAALPVAVYVCARVIGVAEPFEVVNFLNGAFLILATSGAAAGSAAAMCVLPDSYRPEIGTGRSVLRELIGGFLIGTFLGAWLSEIPGIAWITPTREFGLAASCFVSGFAGPATFRYAMPIGRWVMDWYAEKRFDRKKRDDQ